MGHPLSCDLRDRALAAVDAELSRRGAAERFRVSAASVIRWDQLRRLQGHARPKPQGGDKTSHRIEAHAEVILEAVPVQPDITLKELRARLEHFPISLHHIRRRRSSCGILGARRSG